MATLTFSYADHEAVLGPLAPRIEPGSYDLCREHARTLSAPKGWEVTRLPGDYYTMTSQSDVMALADLIRRAGQPDRPVLSRRKGHLAVVAD